jgi:microcystin-dependent protein
MSEPFLGEVRMFGAGVVPKGWTPCEGQTLPIMSNQALFSLLGTTFGGNGSTTFCVPDLRGRVALGVSPLHPAGQAGGQEAHALSVSEIPAHTHVANASSKDPVEPALQNKFWAKNTLYAPTADTTMAANALANAGGSAPHPNMQPYMALSFCIATTGIYPSRP